jgi:hypothetical protein
LRRWGLGPWRHIYNSSWRRDFGNAAAFAQAMIEAALESMRACVHLRINAVILGCKKSFATIPRAQPRRMMVPHDCVELYPWRDELLLKVL